MPSSSFYDTLCAGPQSPASPLWIRLNSYHLSRRPSSAPSFSDVALLLSPKPLPPPSELPSLSVVPTGCKPLGKLPELALKAMQPFNLHYYLSLSLAREDGFMHRNCLGEAEQLAVWCFRNTPAGLGTHPFFSGELTSSDSSYSPTELSFSSAPDC